MINKYNIMKNCKNGKYKIKKKEKNNLYKKDFHISLTNKFLLFILTIIHLIIKAKADGSIIIYGFTNIVIYIKDASSYERSSGSCSGIIQISKVPVICLKIVMV